VKWVLAPVEWAVGICEVAKGARVQERLPVGEHIHLNGLDRVRFPVNHAPDSLCRVAAEDRFAAVEVDCRENLLNPNGLTFDIKNLVDQFLTVLCVFR
jgi:hypothetical protein